MTNYRTISLLTVSSKLFEKVMISRSSHHLHTNNIMAKEEYGFRKGTLTKKSCLQTNKIYYFISLTKK